MGLFLGMVGMVLSFGGLVLLLVSVVMRLLKRPQPRITRWPLLLGAVVVGFGLTIVGGALMAPSLAAEAGTPSGQETAAEAAPQRVPAEATESQDSATQTPEPPAAPETTAERINIGLFLVKCRSEVKSQLKSPATAKFPGSMESAAQAEETDAGERTWNGYVDSQNGFGATVRTQFECRYDPADPAGEVAVTMQE
ncbi:hypothetical protein DEDE109153_18035 [Deinococcus deserti]|uniref:Uncharacterized protein n=1 Tax=Deinococcus deserti (strain DSM 17065 / CIP 109153 / LMG 22923 / VCD115) TaxID=546414 RepID=C1CZ63_DEIDV|nr:hypothetical protein [Deinococcus deserti]ACO45101.1 Hypothetical protein; putative membrane protein [Deinococcus deserti VCD115]